mmetsp:Transcript_64115/g.164998  ORF Transcript_64115/g.164998 Transcript_64115/m.164998 type:complete len:305 (-) Transcript_64115:361-1275(-)
MSPVCRSPESGILKRLKASRHRSTSASDTWSSVASFRNSSRSPRPSIFSSSSCCSSSCSLASASPFFSGSTFFSRSGGGSSAFFGTLASTLCAQPSAWSLLMSSHTCRVASVISLREPASLDSWRFPLKLVLVLSMSSQSLLVSSAILRARCSRGSSYFLGGGSGAADAASMVSCCMRPRSPRSLDVKLEISRSAKISSLSPMQREESMTLSRSALTLRATLPISLSALDSVASAVAAAGSLLPADFFAFFLSSPAGADARRPVGLCCTGGRGREVGDDSGDGAPPMCAGAVAGGAGTSSSDRG